MKNEKPGLIGEDYASAVLRQAAKLVNFVWLLARLHRRPEAVRFLAELQAALAPPPRPPGR